MRKQKTDQERSHRLYLVDVDGTEKGYENGTYTNNEKKKHYINFSTSFVTFSFRFNLCNLSYKAFIETFLFVSLCPHQGKLNMAARYKLLHL